MLCMNAIIASKALFTLGFKMSLGLDVDGPRHTTAYTCVSQASSRCLAHCLCSDFVSA